MCSTAFALLPRTLGGLQLLVNEWVNANHSVRSSAQDGIFCAKGQQTRA